MESLQLATLPESQSKRSEQQHRRNSLLRRWLGAFALNAGQPLDSDALSVYVTLWTEGFADLSDDVLEVAFRETLATCKFWPVKIADVREHVERAEESRAEDEWQNVLEYARRHVYPDPLESHTLSPEVLRNRFPNYLSVANARPPRLPADIGRAAAAAGGLRFIESCSTEELIWAKKRFLESLARQRQVGGIADALPASPLAQLLERTAQRFSLPAPSEPAPTYRLIAEKRRLEAPNDLTCYAVNRPENPEFVAWQQKQAERDPAVVEYQKAHGLRVQKTPSLDAPQATETTPPAGAVCGVQETLVSGASA